MSKKVSVWTDNRFWQRSAAWVTGVAAMLLIWLTFDTMSQIQMGTKAELDQGITKRVPSPTVINHRITYEMNDKRGHEVPVIGEKEKFFGRDDYSEEEAMALLNLGKLASQTKNCMNCHTLLGNGAYYAPDLTKAWLDPMWDSYMLRMGKASKEEAIAEFLQHPSDNPSNERMMRRISSRCCCRICDGFMWLLYHLHIWSTSSGAQASVPRLIVALRQIYALFTA